MPVSLWVDHFGIALRSLDAGEDFFSRYLPLQPIGGVTPGASGDARSRFYQLGHVRLALFESARPDSFIENFLNKRGEGIHHLSFRCADLDLLESNLRAGGLAPTEGPFLAEQGRTLVLPPSDLFGMFFLIVETPEDPPPIADPRDRIVQLPGGGAMLFDHMAAAVPDLDVAKRVLTDNFPITKDGGRHRGYAGDFDLSQFELAGFRFELVADASGSSFVKSFLHKRGPGFHHLSIDVEELDPILEKMRSDGLRIVDESDLGNGYKTAFISPRSAHGVLVQFWQVPELAGEALAVR
ncbi:MAG TPA: hypothetical protein DCG06_01185 [Deltaproteobacteria bacterium]|nr:hypothetical protein [Deltaproteobacteria bacterium]